MTKLEITPEQEKLARFAKAMGHPTKVKYCINVESWREAQEMFAKLFKDCYPNRKPCCNKD